LIQLKERSLPFQSNDQQPTQSLRQADVQAKFYSEWYFFQRSSPPQPSTAVHTYVHTLLPLNPLAEEDKLNEQHCMPSDIGFLLLPLLRGPTGLVVPASD